MVDTCMKVSSSILENYSLQITVINCRFIKPIDIILLTKLIDYHNNFVVVEEGVISGGFGS